VRKKWEEYFGGFVVDTRGYQEGCRGQRSTSGGRRRCRRVINAFGAAAVFTRAPLSLVLADFAAAAVYASAPPSLMLADAAAAAVSETPCVTPSAQDQGTTRGKGPEKHSGGRRMINEGTVPVGTHFVFYAPCAPTPGRADCACARARRRRGRPARANSWPGAIPGRSGEGSPEVKRASAFAVYYWRT